MIKRLATLAAIPALVLSLACAGPALAQQAAAQAPAASAATASPGQAAAANPRQRTVRGRELLTREERRTFRREFMDATPERQVQIWEQIHSRLEHRAAEHGMTVAEPELRQGGTVTESRGGGDSAAGGGARFVVFVARAPHAP